ncbi:MAG TPA: T9SS type A sorting domain-containing protein, partial [Ignavibacteriaceae bacterium]|nr:T9SS type A sorting domain-containing protein [Ignavibacteriaceae bacterium]
DHNSGEVVELLISTSVENSSEFIATEYSLSQNYPNPFNPSTRIKYQVTGISRVSLKVYDILGREAATLVNEEKPAGTHQVTFDASSLASGIYFYKIQAGSFVETKKMILLR